MNGVHVVKTFHCVPHTLVQHLPGVVTTGPVRGWEWRQQGVRDPVGLGEMGLEGKGGGGVRIVSVQACCLFSSALVPACAWVHPLVEWA